MVRPELNEVEIPAGVNRQFPECVFDLAPPGFRTVTMSTGQWDGLLQATYEAGWLLLELDANERLIRAYRRPWS